MTLVREYQPTFVLGDGETKEFSYLFEEVSENFIKVIVKHSDDSTYVPVFSVDLDSHKVVFGESETAPLDTDVVCIYRETPDLQDTPFRTLQGYDAKALENILSKIVAMIQELKANGFSTQILQGTPWQLDLLHPDDDGASVVVDYNARILKKGLYFQLVGGNLQVSADGNNFIKMPKSADITEFRQKEVITEDLVEYVLQYRVNGVWYNAGGVGGSGLPDQTGNAGKFLTTDGTDASWGTTLTETLYLTGDNTQNKIVFNDGNNDSQKTTLRATWNSILFEHGNDGTFTQAFSFSWLYKAIYPVGWRSSDVVTLGTSDYKWSNVYTNKLNNGADIEVPNQAGTMIVADPTGATQGQVLTLDSNLKPAWADASSGGGSGLNVGDTFMTKRTDNELNGAVECDGATYNTTDFTGAENIGALLAAGKVPYVSLADYATEISTKGWCDKIGWDGTGNTQFRVPTLNAHIVQTNNIPVVGNGMVLGLSNGTVNFGCYKTTQNNYPRFALNSRDYGKNIGESVQDATSSEGNDTTIGITTDGTKSGIIADTSDTAQLRVMIQLATGATDQALETCTGVLADVAALKYDYVVDFQAPTAQNNYTWYRKYKSGWVEQGGTDTSSSEDLSVTLPVTMANNNYQVQLTLGNTTKATFANQYWSTFGWRTKTTTGFTCTVNVANAGTKDWFVCGMAAS